MFLLLCCQTERKTALDEQGRRVVFAYRALNNLVLTFRMTMQTSSDSNLNVLNFLIDNADEAELSLSESIQIASGGWHTLVLREDGTVWAFGENRYYQLGYDSGEDIGGLSAESGVLHQVTGIDNVAAIAAGGLHTLALKTDGTVWSWGTSHNGEGAPSVPTEIPDFTDVILIDAK